MEIHPMLASDWAPVRPPGRGERRLDKQLRFHAYMLVPGFSMAFHAETQQRTLQSIASYRKRAAIAARQSPSILVAVQEILSSIKAEDGLAMALQRGTTQLPYWSRLAVCEFFALGWQRKDLSIVFRCSYGTIANVLKGKGSSYNPLSGERRLTRSQMSPPGMWHRQFEQHVDERVGAP